MIDSELLDAYVAELEALRVHGRDLARAYPDIAGRLDIGPRRSRDGQVERVVESSAFLAARLRLMIESSATELPLAVLTMLAPWLVEPIPAMAILELTGGAETQKIDRGTRFDYMLAGQALVCFSTTMDLTAAPVHLRLRRLEPSAGAQDGIGVKIQGEPPSTLTLCLGDDEMNAAVLVDAISEDLTGIEMIPPGGGQPRIISKSHIEMCGFSSTEAALPVRSAANKAARIVTEFMAFPEKFRFMKLTGIPLESGTELLFRFKRQLPSLPPRLPQSLITVNKVPAVNLWQSSATPFDIDGRQLEFPVRVDALRYRTVECHSVESVSLYHEGNSKPVTIDPIVSFGNIRGTEVRWGVRRGASRVGGEVLLYFQGLDYRTLGYQRYLAAPKVLASNRDVAQRAVVGTLLQSVDSGTGAWKIALSSPPTAYQYSISNSLAMETLTSYIHSSMNGFTGSSKGNLLRNYLKRFPCSTQANWINGIQSVALRSIAGIRNGKPQTGLALILAFNSERYKTTSKATVKRVLGELFNSQRAVNRIDELIVQTA